MKHYGDAPPWNGESIHYGRWLRGETFWDGTTEWMWYPPLFPGRTFAQGMSDILKVTYLQTVQNQLNQEILIQKMLYEPLAAVAG